MDVNYLNDAKLLSKDDFVKKHNHPFLVSFKSDDKIDNELRFATVAIQISLDEILKRANSGIKTVDKVLAIKNSGRNPFNSKIIVGRTSTQDIVIDSTKISKFHAFFQSSNEIFSLTDRGSTNGTLVNLKKLEPNKSVNIKSGDTVAFCDFTFTFYSSGEAYDKLK